MPAPTTTTTSRPLLAKAHSAALLKQRPYLVRHRCYVCLIGMTSIFRDEEKTMGTRQVYEEKLRAGNLQHDPTMNPSLGSARCPRCLSLINPNPEKGKWAITNVLHDAAGVASSGAGGLLSAVHSMNSGIPFTQQHVKGPKWLQFSVGIPLLLLYSGVSGALGAYLLPAFTQLGVSASYYAISRAN